MGRRYIREQKIKCGAWYQEIDLFPITERQAKSSVRAKKAQASREGQQNLNARNARRYLVQLLACNFGPGDLHLTCTYCDEALPGDWQEAERHLRNYLRRIAAHCRAKGMEAPAYVAVTEWQEADREAKRKAVRFHHHIVLRCALDRDELEQLWAEKGVRLGWCNADRLQLDQGSLEALAGYLVKYTNRARRWKQSRGLQKPVRPRPNDSRWSGRKLENLVRRGEVYDRRTWEKAYPGWFLRRAEPVYNEILGEWSIYLQMWRPRPIPKRAQGA